MTRDEQIDALLMAVQISDNGRVISLCPKNQDGNMHARFHVTAQGAAVGEDPLDSLTYGTGNLFVGGRCGIQTAIGFTKPPSTKDLSATGAFPDAAALSVQASNIPDQVTLNVWSGDRIPDDGQDAIALFVSTSDAYGRKASRNVGVRIDASNEGRVSAIDAREVGTVPPTQNFAYPGDARLKAIAPLYFPPMRGLYAEAHQVCDDIAIAVWLGRLEYDMAGTDGSKDAELAAHHLAELKTELGL